METRRALRAVLFDLDDTLFDHLAAARAALTVVHRRHDCFRDRPFAEFEKLHAAFLEELHADVLTGARGIDAARIERFRRVFVASGVEPDATVLEETAASYRREYLDGRRPIEGAHALLTALKPRVRIGIVSNNLLDEQRGKIALCNFTALVDALVVSEEAGVSKPDPAIFRLALERLDCAPDEAVMIGDSWSADVFGARAAGIRAIWFNRLGQPCPDPPGSIAELNALHPIARVMAVIFGQEHAPGLSNVEGQVSVPASQCGLV